LVAVIDAVIALPMAFYTAKFASLRAQRILVIAVMTPLWASYLVKAYSWRTMLSGNGVLHWLLNPFGPDTPGYGLPATVITLSYLWLPYMILPIYAGVERLPNSLVDASGDLGVKSWRTFRSVVLPPTFPAIVAGSIFTFSLSLGDYMSVKIVGGTNQMLGNVVYDNIGAANNLPFAATVATVPVVIMLGYLAAVRRTGTTFLNTTTMQKVACATIAVNSPRSIPRIVRNAFFSGAATVRRHRERWPPLGLRGAWAPRSTDSASAVRTASAQSPSGR
jgi:putative spermidine/putrescine transport system permease protein